MPILTAQVRIPRVNNLPEDVIINTWHIQSAVAGSQEAMATAFQTDLEDFYVACSAIFPSALISEDWEVRYYDINAEPPAIPVVSFPMHIELGSPAPAPAELAICLSYRATYVSGSPSARRRGRVYLGPCSTEAFQSLNGDVRVAVATRTAITAAAEGLLTASSASTAYDWVVFSPTTHQAVPGGGDFGFFPVIGGWVDNAFDIQRRRGSDATVRQLWPAP